MPKALEASAKMLEGKPQEEVFSRLYKRKEYQPRQPTDAEEPHMHANPQIKLHRGTDISTALNDLHKTRLQKKQDMKKHLE